MRERLSLLTARLLGFLLLIRNAIRISFYLYGNLLASINIAECKLHASHARQRELDRKVVCCPLRIHISSLILRVRMFSSALRANYFRLSLDFQANTCIRIFSLNLVKQQRCRKQISEIIAMLFVTFDYIRVLILFSQNSLLCYVIPFWPTANRFQ